MRLTSPAFQPNASIPSTYTCDGNDMSPPLLFSDVPAEAKSLVLIADDPDVPSGIWVHWVVWNINPKTTEASEGMVPGAGIEGITSFGRRGYGGPCPPSGTHRYVFKLYALDTLLDLPEKASKLDVEGAMDGHVIDSAELIGVYER
ncbi:MAG: YbhB/YbcL family Raf kinase inhibitor-like protein [Patescibacteria group bacterium]